jgi:hypothetical protein
MTLDESLSLLNQFMRELVPGEVYNIEVDTDEHGEPALRLETESKRAIVAWSELQYMWQEMLNKHGDENIG